MKSIFLLIGTMLLCCSSPSAQVDALDNNNPFFNDETSKNAPLPTSFGLFPKLDETVKTYSVRHIKTGRATGYHILLDNNGDTIYRASYKRKSLKGAWVSYYLNNTPCDSGYLDHNIPSGTWKSWFANGRLRSIRTFSAAKLKAIKNNLLRYNPKSNFDPILTVEKMRPGSFNKYTNASQSFIKYVDTDVLNLASAMSINEKAYINRLDKAHYLPPFTECFHEGLYMDFYPSGEVMDSGYYKNGLRDGAWVEKLYNATIVAKGAYHHGYKIEIWSFYNLSGKLVGLKRFNKKGEEVSAKYFR